MDKNTDPKATVAVSDWGVIPFTLKRTCYPVLNDESHLYTLKRMDKYQTEYLVILDKMGYWAPYARDMVKDIPHIFTLLYEIKHDDGSGPDAAVYKVDLEGVGEYLKRKKPEQVKGHGNVD